MSAPHAAAWLDTVLFAGDRPGRGEAEALASRPDLRFIEAPGVRLRVRVQRVPGAPAVVMLPDSPNIIEHYDEVFDHWAGRLTVVALEAPGFGFSWASRPEVLSYANARDAVVQVLDELELGSMVVTGGCTMAYLAIGAAAAMAAQTLGVVASQATDLAGERRWVHRALDPEGWLREPGIGQLAWAQPDLRERLAIDTWYAAAAGPGGDLAAWRDKARWAHRCGCSDALASHVQGWFAEDHSITVPVADCPAVILFGQADRTHSRSDPAGLVRYLPRAQVRLSPTAGHFPDLEDFPVFAAAVEGLASPT